MTRKKTRSFVPVLMACAFFLTMVGFAATPSGASTSPPAEEEALAEEDLGVENEAVPSSGTAEPVAVEFPQEGAAPSLPPQPGAVWLAYPNACETFTVIEGKKRVKNKRTEKLTYPVRYRRNRYDRKRSHQKRTRQLIRMVAKEMGADEDGQYLVEMMAHHESSWSPEAIHILNPDRAANTDAWERYSYDAGREMELQAKLRKASARSKKFWDIRVQLSDLRVYKDNPFWNAQLEYKHKIPERTLHGETTEAQEFTEHRSVWTYGYGLFGMNAVLFTSMWDREAPPWVLCGDEGIVATVTAIWSLRKARSDCAFLTGKNPDKYGTDGGSARGIIRRFARGRCGNKKLGKAWQRLMVSYADHVDWDRAPDLGHKFPRYQMYKRGGKWRFRYQTEIDPETGEERDKRDGWGRRIKIRIDRMAILAHMREKAGEQNLLRTTPLQRKKPDTAPVIVASVATSAP